MRVNVANHKIKTLYIGKIDLVELTGLSAR
jgi:hypothetical protein